MKKSLIIILLLLITASVIANGLDSLPKQSPPASNNIPANNSAKQQPSTSSTLVKPGCAGYILVYLPIGLFIIAVIAINVQTKDFKLADALTENQYVKKTEINPAYNIDNLVKIQASPSVAQALPPVIEVSDVLKGLPKSSSRYMALLTGALTLIIACCLVSLFIYSYVNDKTPPQLEELGNVLLALGIGITPYAVNKVSAAVSNNKNQ